MFTVLMTPKMTLWFIFSEVIFQGTGNTLDLSEEDANEEEGCGIHVYLGEPSYEHGTFDKLATTVETVDTLVD